MFLFTISDSTNVSSLSGSVLRRILVQPDPDSFQFSRQQHALFSLLRRIKHHQNEITRLQMLDASLLP